jgi:predicted RNA-binding protein
MCQAKVILQQDGETKLFMEDVIHIKVDDDKVWLSTFFEPPKSLSAYIKEADFLKHTITLVSLRKESDES